MAKKSKSNKYKLYACALQDLPQDSKYSFYQPNKYMLVYIDKELDADKYVEVAQNIIDNQLSKEARYWLSQCQMAVTIEEMKKHEVEYSKTLNRFLNLFEKELEAETKNAAKHKENEETPNSEDANA